MRVKLRSKLIVAFLTVGFCTLSLFWLNSRITHELHSSVNDLTTSVTPLTQSIGDLRSTVFRLIEESFSYQLLKEIGSSNSIDLVNSELEQAKDALSKANELLHHFETITRFEDNDSPEQAKILDLSYKIISICSKLISQDRHLTLVELMNAKKEIEELEDDFDQICSKGIEIELLDIKSRLDIASESLDKSDRITNLAIIATFILSLTGALLLSYLIAKPIVNLQKAVNQITHGNFTTRIEAISNDEIGDLAQSFNLMSENLSKTTVSRKFLNNIFESLPDSLVVVDQNLKCITVNTAFNYLCGIKSTDIIGNDLRTIISFETIDNISTPLTTDFALIEASGSVISKGGEKIPLSISINPLSDNSDSQESHLVLIRDLRATLRSQFELQQYRNRMNRAETLASLGTLGAIVAHKLNQPLTAIRLFLQQIIKRTKELHLPMQVMENLGDSLSEVERAQSIVQEVLSSTKNNPNNQTSEINLADIAAKAVKALSIEALKSKIKISYSSLKQLPNYKGNQLELEEMFYILIHNAIQAAKNRENCNLNIGGEILGNYLRLQFNDNCGGIPSEYENKLFDTFFSTKPIGEGSGLGLHILKQLVTNHKGTIDFKNSPGEGTTFYLNLPLTI